MNPEQQDKLVLQISKAGTYVIPGDSTRPVPVTPQFGAPSPVPSATERRNARLFLKLKREAAAVELGVLA